MRSALIPPTLRERVRLVSFAVVLVGVTALAVAPLRDRLTGPATSETDVLRTSALVLFAVIVLVLGSQAIARWFAELVLGAIDALALDVHRSVVAEARGRRGERFLEARPEAIEIARLRGEVGDLLATVRARGRADRTVLGATVHDLKAGLAGLAHLIDSESSRVAAAGGQPSRSLEVAGAEARRLAALLSTMMTYLRSGQSAPEHMVEVDLGAVARTAAAQVRPVRPEVGLTVTAVGATRATGDATLLTHALENLIGNAVRVARSSVVVTVYPGVVRIEDDGPGLAGDLSALIAPFASDRLEDGDRAIAAGSLGLGLYIAHRVLEGHEGGLGVERSDARGTVMLAYVGRSAT